MATDNNWSTTYASPDNTSTPKPGGTTTTSGTMIADRAVHPERPDRAGGGINTYGYVEESPLRYIDPNGNSALEKIGDWFDSGEKAYLGISCSKWVVRYQKAQLDCARECPAGADSKKLLEFVDKYKASFWGRLNIFV
ncbi:hypothetical protein [Chitiniphilus eburneus]|uniref:RHS repeat-associated core domain-containing protein n=1 Tax=Chitiniphilus eburneus TaxID=2571148 RepID=A0A4U0Q005_9NEIS|nr:hypothetical protein [Chitiniphilus eburneus]TJZ73890.1 hypothetical protein FAZ21_09750 [Chitiniphilus eburneus]